MIYSFPEIIVWELFSQYVEVVRTISLELANILLSLINKPFQTVTLFDNICWIMKICTQQPYDKCTSQRILLWFIKSVSDLTIVINCKGIHWVEPHHPFTVIGTYIEIVLIFLSLSDTWWEWPGHLFTVRYIGAISDH